MNTNKLSWSSSIRALSGSKVSQTIIKLEQGGIKTLGDLLWVFPLRLQPAPSIKSFTHALIDELFWGAGEIVSINFSPTFKRRGKGGIPLFNGHCLIKDHSSEMLLNLKWFNVYPGLKKQLESYQEFSFLGKVSEFNGQLQIVNPKINPNQSSHQNGMLIEYPTINTVSGKNLERTINRIPAPLWEEQVSLLSFDLEKKLNLKCLNNAFKVMHAKVTSHQDARDLALERIKYEEFLKNQLMMLARKKRNLNLKAPILHLNPDELKGIVQKFPYKLTTDQMAVSETIQKDLSSSSPMMRLIQGDVGCGKTTVAIIAALISVKNNYQVALMCPTEALASQHFHTLKSMDIEETKISLLIGSMKTKEKEAINQALLSGQCQFVIGTHALIQQSVEFKNLGLVIIDEQHKFGVEQRQKLAKKANEGIAHTLIMSATPIPRSLQLAQYGDLNISTIKSMPDGRKGIKTRVVTNDTYSKYLSFIKTRMSIGEQVYIVVPAIEDSETLDIKSVLSLEKEYKKYFPEFSIGTLHGQLDSKEKEKIMSDFANAKIDLLISTTVIEVGINVVNSTVISIYNPDRFGLSSLHQLRGRVGRGDKAGFCFLITDEKTSKEAMQRLKIVEKTLDGFEIAEADLKNRGMGDLFGNNQSGHLNRFKAAHIFTDFSIFEKVSSDIEVLKSSETEFINQLLLNFIEDPQVSSTI